jgi:hypothetical protein
MAEKEITTGDPGRVMPILPVDDLEPLAPILGACVERGGQCASVRSDPTQLDSAARREQAWGMKTPFEIGTLCLIVLLCAPPLGAEPDSEPSKPPAEIPQEAGTKIGHAFRDAAREIGHASRDAWNESADARQEAGDGARAASESAWQSFKTSLRDAWQQISGSPESQDN